MLLTKDCFSIQIETPKAGTPPAIKSLASDVGLQVARNLYQYFRADAEILPPHTGLMSHNGNVITIALGRELKQSLLPSYPITVAKDKGVCIQDSGGDQHVYAFGGGLGIVCVRPLQQERLECVVWGFDGAGLRYAARLLPTLTVSNLSRRTLDPPSQHCGQWLLWTENAF